MDETRDGGATGTGGSSGRSGEGARTRDGDAGEVADPEAGDGEVSTILGAEVDPTADGPAAFMQALRVSRNAKIGVVVGVGFFVVIPGTYRQPLWYVGLGFVLALSTAGLVATLLTLGRAVRLSRNL